MVIDNVLVYTENKEFVKARYLLEIHDLLAASP